ncbi:MAG: GNAT family N-acetyltransferase [Desulfovibrio sp.]|jgi:hypothetical protein|nr:GNAT family N-acetyltransferase [Desulfovibrio sp.]
MNRHSPLYANLLEPEAILRLFTAFPPLSFDCRISPSGLPVFRADFDLLTTLDRKARKYLARLPLFSRWSGVFRFPACFCGTTLTEYAPLPAILSPRVILDEFMDEYAAGASLLILKDLPLDSPLLPLQDQNLSRALADEAKRRGFLEVQGQALAYVPLDFSSVDEYLARLSPRRRKDLRRKWKKRDDISVSLLPFGDPLFSDPAFLEQAYAMYLNVYRQSEIHFDLLSRDFFTALLQNDAMDGVVFLYRHKEILAGYNICLVRNDMLIDKYIGFTYPLARERNLYFISWMMNLEYALEKNLSHYIAGWTDPEVKAALGARFTFTRHLVRMKNPLLRRMLSPLRPLFEADGRAVGTLS